MTLPARVSEELSVIKHQQRNATLAVLRAVEIAEEVPCRAAALDSSHATLVTLFLGLA